MKQFLKKMLLSRGIGVYRVTKNEVQSYRMLTETIQTIVKSHILGEFVVLGWVVHVFFKKLPKEFFDIKVNDRWDQPEYKEVRFPVKVLGDMLIVVVEYFLSKNKNSRFVLKLDIVERSILVTIETREKRVDHWFNTNASIKNKIRDLMDEVSQFFRYGVTFERSMEAKKGIVFKLAVNCDTFKESIEKDKEKTLDENVIDKSYGIHNATHAPNTYYYKTRETPSRFCKVDSSPEIKCKKNRLLEEFDITSRLSSVKGCPMNPELVANKNHSKLFNDFIPGVSLNKELVKRLSMKDKKKLIVETSNLLTKITFKGVLHNDIIPRNFIMTDSGDIFLIDFDQAIFMDIDDICLKKQFSNRFYSYEMFLKDLGLFELYCDLVRETTKIWSRAGKSDASSPGVALTYYSWNLGETIFPGERLFAERVLIIENSGVNFKGLKVLDVGSNLGLISMYCSFSGARSVISIDLYEDILEEAGKLAGLFEVDNVTRKNIDLSMDKKIIELGKGSDIAIVFSVYHWLKDKTIFDDFMRTLNCVFYEGHEGLEIEQKRLKEWGFNDVRIIGYTDRIRAVFLAQK